RLRWSGLQVRRFVVDASDHGVPQSRRRLFLIAWRGSDCRTLDFAKEPRVNVKQAFGALGDDHSVIQLPKPVEAAIARRIGPGMKLSNVRFSDRCVHTWDIP